MAGHDDVAALIRAHLDELSPSERRVADAVVADPELVAFGTVADVAGRSGSSGSSVVRFAGRLGLSGFSELQSMVQGELGAGIRQAARRIHRPPADDLAARAREVAVAAVDRSLGSMPGDVLDRAVRLLADVEHRVVVLASDASRGVASQFATELAMVRPGVTELGGSPVAVHRAIADTVRGDVVVALDLPRYDRWLLDALDAVRDRRATTVALTDSPLSPVAVGAAAVLVVDAEGIGPFDSHLASLAVFEALVAGVAASRHDDAARHLADIESAWAEGDVFGDG